ncbi:MAG TPA: hypothetical protein VGG33_26645 [Polyangia bacterium]
MQRSSRLTARLLIVSFLAGVPLFGGCVVVEKRRPTAYMRSSCHPSQYWDGQTCRHKGKGHGARKHDGRGKR